MAGISFIKRDGCNMGLEMNKVYCENCLDTMVRMESNSVELTMTSPPYDNMRFYNGYVFDFQSIAIELFRVTKIGGIVIWIVGDSTKDFGESLTSFRQAIYFVDVCGFKLLDTMIWEKPNYAPGYPSLRRYDNVFEYMFVFCKGRPKTVNLICDKPKTESSKNREKYKTSYTKQNGSRDSKDIPVENGKDFCRRTNVWKVPNGQIRGIGHPAVFPESLARDHILTWSSEGDMVYDPFMGSGTTAKMSILTGRRWIGSEISKDYCEIIEKRIQEC